MTIVFQKVWKVGDVKHKAELFAASRFRKFARKAGDNNVIWQLIQLWWPPDCKSVSVFSVLNHSFSILATSLLFGVCLLWRAIMLWLFPFKAILFVAEITYV